MKKNTLLTLVASLTCAALLLPPATDAAQTATDESTDLQLALVDVMLVAPGPLADWMSKNGPIRTIAKILYRQGNQSFSSHEPNIARYCLTPHPSGLESSNAPAPLYSRVDPGTENELATDIALLNTGIFTFDPQ
jgi:hypothetical protein